MSKIGGSILMALPKKGMPLFPGPDIPGVDNKCENLHFISRYLLYFATAIHLISIYETERHTGT